MFNLHSAKNYGETIQCMGETLAPPLVAENLPTYGWKETQPF